ncbi:MAG TPA: Omp28 family outer membrane lipoprotein [Bacteroidia bacterium]|jgi:hypothetical protein
MKRSRLFLLLAAGFALAQSCDKVKFPYETSSSSNGNPNAVVRKVLLEDFTGTSCGNCPPAGATATQLEDQYKPKVIGLTIHAGLLATPSPPNLPYDFRTAVGTDYYNTFGIQANPTGMVNRIGFPTSSHLLNYGAWGSAINNIINNPPDADIQLTNTFNTNNRDLQVDVKCKFLTAKTNAYYKLVLLLKEDSIVEPQKDDLASPNIVTNYMHRNILRGAINGNGTGWGDTLVAGNIAVGDSVMNTYHFTVPSSYTTWTVVDSHCYVVAFIYDADASSATHYEVIQAEEKKIK